jgi:hypothetical protein
MPGPPTRGWRLVGWGVLVYGLALNCYQGYTLGMHRWITLWVIQTIPVALADLQFGHPADYTGMAGVLAVYQAKPDPPEFSLVGSSSATINRAIDRVLAARGTALDRTPYLANPDDKGITDLVKLAFLLFGYRSERIILVYVVVLALSCLAFLLRFGAERWAVLLLAAFLLSHYILLPTVSINPQLHTVLALRFLSVAGFAAALHLALEVWLAEPLTRYGAAALLFQAAVLATTLHTRFSAMWEVLFVLAAAPVPLLRWLHPRAGSPAPRCVGPLLAGTFALAILLLLPVYKKAVYSPEYFQKGAPSHFFWHSLYTGLAYSPPLARKYALRVDDWSVIWCARNFYASRHGVDAWNSLGCQDRYEEVVRTMWFDAVRRHRREVFWCLAYHKPLVTAQYVAWLSGLRSGPPRPEILWPHADEELARISRRIHDEGLGFRPFRFECCFPFLLLVWRARRQLIDRAGSLVAFFALFFACSTMPSILGYPTAHTICDLLATVGMAAYLAVGGCFLAVLGVVDFCRRSPSPALPNPRVDFFAAPVYLSSP